MTPTLLLIAVAELHESPTNPRKTFKQSSLDELAESLKQNGLLHPIVARPRAEGGYEVVTGARRTRAARIAGLVDVPVTVREYTDDQVLEIQIIENSQREDVDPLEEAYGYRALVDRGLYDAAGLASKVSKSIDTIHRRLALSRLDPKVAADMTEVGAPLVAMELVATLADIDDQAVAGKWWHPDTWFHGTKTYAAFKMYVAREFLTELERAIFDLEDATLNPDMGPCASCQFNTGSTTSLFPDGTEESRCLKPSCFRAKSHTFFDRKIEDAKARGLTILSLEWSTRIKDALPREEWDESKAKDAEKGFIVETWDTKKMFTEVTFKRKPKRSTSSGSSSGGYERPKVDQAQRRETLRLLRAEMISRRTVFDEVLRQFDGDPEETCEALTTPEFWRAIAVTSCLVGGKHPVQIYETRDPVTGRHPGHDFRAEEIGLKTSWHSIKLKDIEKMDDSFPMAVRTLFIAKTYHEIHVGEGNNYQPFVLMAAVDALKIDLDHIRKEADWSTLSKKAQRERLKAEKDAAAPATEEKPKKAKGKKEAKVETEPTAEAPAETKPKRARKKKDTEGGGEAE